MNIELLERAFENFMQESFHESAVTSTRVWGEYCVELLDDGTYRVLWSGNIGDRYESDGIILGIPSLNDEDWDSSDENLPYAYIGNAEALMREKFTDYLGSVRNYNATQG